MTTIYNNTLRITGSKQDIALMPKWKEIGFIDTKTPTKHNQLFMPILPASQPERRLEIWGVKSDCVLESVDRSEGQNNNATVKLQFDSQENTPLIGIKNLAQIYPNLSFNLEYNMQGEPKASVKITKNWGSCITISRTQIIKECAADFLSTSIPQAWDNWNTAEQEEFIAKNPWGAVEYLDSSTISELIWSTSNNVANLLINSGISVVDDE